VLFLGVARRKTPIRRSEADQHLGIKTMGSDPCRRAACPGLKHSERLRPLV
jgi:hypothetical protein